MRSQTERKPHEPKVFCIGWHKTGTTSLGHALTDLGYRVLGCRLDMVYPLKRNDFDEVLRLVEEFDALQDVPWAALYKLLDQKFPNSKFIFTDRSDQAWLGSAARHFGASDIPLHEWLYGIGKLEGNEDIYLSRYRGHRKEVKEYFRERERDLLVLELERGLDWYALCEFLGCEVPAKGFPHANRNPDSATTFQRFVANARQSVPKSIKQAWVELRQAWARLRGKEDPLNPFHNRIQNNAEIAKLRRVGRDKRL